ncbi:MAG: DUF6585 family protein [Myxococcota bacterium]
MTGQDANLGAMVSVHNGRMAAGGLGWYVAGVMALAAVVGVFRALVSARWGELLYLLVMLATLGAYLFWLYARWKQKLTIYQHGFIHQPVLGAARAVRFDEVEHVDVRREVNRRAVHLKGEHVRITLHLNDGKRMVLTNDIADVEHLTGYIRRP